MTWHYVTTDAPGWTTPYSNDQQDNAGEIWATLVTKYGWTENSASAVLGNFQAESYINPGQWEIGYNYSMSRGMGLGQWTPATKISNYIGSADRDAMADGAKQMMLLLSNPSQYSTHYLNPDGTSNYYNESGLPYITSMDDFSHSTANVDVLTKVWAICWERPGSSYYQSSIGSRITHAEHWYTTFTGTTPSPQPPQPPQPPAPTPPSPTPPRPPSPDEAQTAIFMLLKRRNKHF